MVLVGEEKGWEVLGGRGGYGSGLGEEVLRDADWQWRMGDDGVFTPHCSSDV